MATRKNSPAKNTHAQQVKDDASYMRDWMMNYDSSARDKNGFVNLVCRILASVPGGEDMEDIGYEPFNIGWKEFEMIQEMMAIIQDSDDVREYVKILNADEDREDMEERRVMPAGRNLRVSQGTVRSSRRRK